jgi:uncharacterized membrane protein YdbT with pleckstrin-like domain
MAEEHVWTGSSSQWKNFGVFLFCLILIVGIVIAALALPPPGPLLIALAAIPALWAFWRWLKTRCRIYRLTSERLVVEDGVLNKTSETLELYRVRDLQVSRPFIHRLVGLENLQLITSDPTTPRMLIDAISAAEKLGDRFRESVEQCRMKKGVREIDIE